MPPILDALLRPVPKHLLGVFAGRQAILGVSWESYRLEQRLLQLIEKEEAGEQIDRAAIKALFEALRREIGKNLPAYPCKRCLKEPQAGCACEGRRWMSENNTKIPGVVKRVYASSGNSSEAQDSIPSPTSRT